MYGSFTKVLSNSKYKYCSYCFETIETKILKYSPNITDIFREVKEEINNKSQIIL